MDIFPSVEELLRMIDLHRWRDIYDGKHRKVYGIKDYLKTKLTGRGDKLLYVAANLASTISEYFADRIVGKGLFFNVSDDNQQKTINEVFKKNRFNIKVYEAAIDQSAYGYVPIRIRDEKEGLIIENIPVDQYFPVFTDSISPELKAVYIASFIEKDENRKKQKYIYRQSYFQEDGRITLEHEYFKEFENHKVEKVSIKLYDPSLPEGRQLLRFRRIPVWQINNVKSASDNFGRSDYKDIDPLFDALNDKLTQLDLQLIKHVDPPLAVPQGTVDADGNVSKIDLGVIEVGTNDFVPQYVVNGNPQIENVFKMIEMLLRMIAALVKVPVESLGVDDSRGDQKVEAMRIRLDNTIRKVDRKRVYMESALIEIAQEILYLSNPKVEVPDVSIVWDDVIPRDDTAVTQMLLEQVGGGLKSKKKAVRELQGIDDEELEAELSEIEGDSQPTIPAFNNKQRNTEEQKPTPQVTLEDIQAA